MKVFFIFPLFICSCSGISAKLLMIEANYLYSKADYTGAIYSYIKAIENEETAPYAEYGLGTVYYAIGEDNAALGRFDEALELIKDSANENKTLSYSINYNKGLVLFNKGDYSGAVNSFRQALLADGSRIEAKRNLELGLLSLAREKSFNSAQENAQGDEDDEGMSAMFNYIRQQELNQWRSMEWQEEEETGPDY